jgi:hypothetical protein
VLKGKARDVPHRQHCPTGLSWFAIDALSQGLAIRTILMAERLKGERQLGLSDFVKALREGR